MRISSTVPIFAPETAKRLSSSRLTCLVKLRLFSSTISARRVIMPMVSKVFDIAGQSLLSTAIRPLVPGRVGVVVHGIGAHRRAAGASTTDGGQRPGFGRGRGCRVRRGAAHG